MPFKIAIASGKGGTGKTTVSVNLYKFFNETIGGNIQLVDCDVEEPNDILFFKGYKKTEQKEVTQLIPEINKDNCIFCRKCADYCEYNAIVIIPSVQFAEVNSNLCHSCGACLEACEQNAITEKPHKIGEITFFKTKEVNGVTEGRLKIGSAMQTLLIKELKKSVLTGSDIILYDAPPGTSCPVVETIHDVNYVVLVTEPTLFGLHDLKLMVQLVRELNLPFGVVVNKAGLGSNVVRDYIEEQQIELLGEIPFSKFYASAYAEGNILGAAFNEVKTSYHKIITVLNHKILQHEGVDYFKW